jgi:hypothetical protein
MINLIIDYLNSKYIKKIHQYKWHKKLINEYKYLYIYI